MPVQASAAKAALIPLDGRPEGRSPQRGYELDGHEREDARQMHEEMSRYTNYGD